VTAAAVIELPSNRWSRLAARLRDDSGLGLVELLISLLVLNVGIFATIGAFTSGALTIRRASRISTAAAIADQKVEQLRDTSYAGIVNQTVDPWPNSPDGRAYKVQVAVTSGSQQTSGTYQGSNAVKVVTVTVSDDADNNRILYTNTSTYSQCAQDLTAAACQS
jgi:Tfp pilus assembly protein PilV